MIDRLWFLMPELIVLGGAVLCAILGVSRKVGVRNLLPVFAGWTLIIAGVVAWLFVYVPSTELAAVATEVPLPWLGRWVVIMSAVVGLMLVFVQAGLVDRVYEAAVAAGRVAFDPLRTTRGEYWVFFLLSVGGLMLTSGASDLVWLFLALELTSLPTYVMVAIGRVDRRSQEAGMKYFFLGALASAVFLYGFAMLYGATGTMSLVDIRTVLAEQVAETGSMNPLATIGLMVAVLGIAFKLAAAPLHLYAADVYEGAAAPVTAFLGFVPKAAGVIALMLLLSVTGWQEDGQLPQVLVILLWVMAVLTMTLGNIGALLQTRIKRMLAYSSIAHSGYLLIGILAGPGAGYTAVLIYLVAYGLSNTATFSVLAGLRRSGQEVEFLDDLAGLRERHPIMAWGMAISAGSLLGFPPLLGFWAKLLLFMAGIASGQLVLVIIAGVNSAISAWYYLKIMAIPLVGTPKSDAASIERVDVPGARFAVVLISGALLVMPVALSDMIADAEAALREPDKMQTVDEDSGHAGGSAIKQEQPSLQS